VKYLSEADRKLFQQHRTWEQRPLTKSERVITEALVFSKMTNTSDDEHFVMKELIHNTFGHMFERRNLIIAALKDPVAMDKVLTLYPYVLSAYLHANTPETSMLSAALRGVSDEQMDHMKAWFNHFIGAMSMIPKFDIPYLVYSGQGPDRPNNNTRNPENKQEALWGVAVNPTAQKTFTELFGYRKAHYFKAIFDCKLHKDKAFAAQVEIDIDEVSYPGLQHVPTIVVNYRGHKATFFTGG